ncbi:thioredoxin domain-containing protein 9 [Anopheles stephensi]|uniref:thioredoxin domain-containing protein 9 n=1 Tax=Anopheles stephensi TaxID=30069 RepID=UPI001658A783|nr:thioredoxin domain-containing protein 9 [Anopheles stephensi]XP_035897971.1 thioredoxin domain-containing protein 9 [Anopheles stephensi]
MEQLIQNQMISAAVQLEKHLDSELDRLENLNTDDLDKLREQRIQQLKKQAQQRQEWKSNGHGEYSELADEKEFFAVSKKSPNIVCHFYRDSAPRCRIVDMHLKILATKHLEARFCKVNAERCPFLTERLRIKVIPSIALIKDSKTKDYIVGFTDLGNCDDFSTEMLEWRIAQSGAIEYSGDLLTPPDVKKQKKPSNLKTIRGGYDSDDSDIDFDD